MSFCFRALVLATTASIAVLGSACHGAMDTAAGGATTSSGGGSAGAGVGGSGGSGGAGGAAISSTLKAQFFMYYENVYVSVTLEGIGPVLLLLDTGAPGIYIDTAIAAQLGLVAGERDVSIGSLDLGPRNIQLANTVFGGQVPPGLPGPISGYAGYGLFDGFSIGLDFRDKELWVTPAGPTDPPAELPDGVETKSIDVPFQVVQGYTSVPCAFGPGAADRVCLFDTGAMTSLAFDAYWQTVPHPSPAVFQQQESDSQGNTFHSYFQRDQVTKVGPLTIGNDAVDVAIDFTLLTSVAQDTGLDLVGLVGVLSFKSMYTTIDYPHQQISFRHFHDTSWLPPSPFIGYEFTLDSVSFDVLFVAPGSSAEAAGIQAGDQLVSIDGVPVSQSPPALSLVQAIPGAPGETATFELVRGGQPYTAQASVGDALPVP
jgi:hypothetical protein